MTASNHRSLADPMIMIPSSKSAMYVWVILSGPVLYVEGTGVLVSVRVGVFVGVDVGVIVACAVGVGGGSQTGRLAICLSTVA